MRTLRLALSTVAIMAVAALTLGFAAAPATAHLSWCHSRHTCPSDHASYRWGPSRLLCVKPTADERDSTFRIRVRYAGRTYYCKR
jgi:hypothetical protein